MLGLSMTEELEQSYFYNGTFKIESIFILSMNYETT